MSEVLPIQKPLITKQMQIKMKTTPFESASCTQLSSEVDYDDFTASSSIIEFLFKEQECCAEVDADSIFEEVSRLADCSDNRSVEEIIQEAEILLKQQDVESRNKIKSQEKPTTDMSTKIQKSIVHFNKTNSLACKDNLSPELILDAPGIDKSFNTFFENPPSVSILSDEFTPKKMFAGIVSGKENKLHYDETTDEGTDTMTDITETIGSIGLIDNKPFAKSTCSKKMKPKKATIKTVDSSLLFYSAPTTNASLQIPTTIGKVSNERRYSCEPVSSRQCLIQRPLSCTFESNSISQNQSAKDINAFSTSDKNICTNSTGGSNSVRKLSSTDFELAKTSNYQNEFTYTKLTKHSKLGTVENYSLESKFCCDRSVNSSPQQMVSVLSSPIHSVTASINREHTLKQEIELLQENLKDTEERLQSLRIQHDSLSQLHRDLRETNTHLQEESEKLKLDVQHLKDCANVLRSELQAARADRNEALKLQSVLQAELETTRKEKKLVLEQKEKDIKVIQDFQRQCREMERILVRKHPDSVSALIVASKNPGKGSIDDHENATSRNLLEHRIAQLESDAKEQDLKAQQILANVQARFNSVQAKYETHIADLETQVLSLQEINTKLNEKIESQVRTLNYFVAKKSDKYYNNYTQTDNNSDDLANNSLVGLTTTAGTQTNDLKKVSMRDHSTNTIGSSSQHSASSSTSSTANSTPNNSRSNSKQSGVRKPTNAMAISVSTLLSSKLPVSYSDSTISHATNYKEDNHLVTALRGMRVDLAIKDKAVQRLTRELEECKKTIRKLQALKTDKPHNSVTANSGNCKVLTDTVDQSTMSSTDTHALKEAQSKIKLLEADYKILHDKRLKDLKTLQTAHERELGTCHESVRVLQQRLNEREEAFATQKRRKVPVDYYALKAKVSSLERRHTEREERLHLLVEALSKGRFNGTLDNLLKDGKIS